MKFIGSLFILVFVYSKVSPKHFLHVFKNRKRTSLPFFLNPHLLIRSAFYQILFQTFQKNSFPKTRPTFVEKGISEYEEKLFQLLSKKAAVLTLFRMGLFLAAHGWWRKLPLA